MRIAIHNGEFHADEAIACALVHFEHPYEEFVICRSRKPEDWEQADLVLDVGGQYGGKFYDHHQEGVPVYENGVKYSATGLYLKHMTALTKQEKQYLLDNGLYAVQARDNGQNLDDLGLSHLPNPFTFVSTLNCDWKTGVYGKQQDMEFKLALEFCIKILRRLIRDARLEESARQQVRTAIESCAGNFVDIGAYCPCIPQIVEDNDGKPMVRAVVFSTSDG